MSYQFQRFGMFVLMIIGLSACSSSHSSEPITVVSLISQWLSCKLLAIVKVQV